MNKINASTPMNHAQLTQQSLPAPARPAMAVHTLTPLIPPGGSPSGSVATRTEQAEVPQWRLALFERTRGEIQQKLTERRQMASEACAQRQGGLTGKEWQVCDAAAQWVSKCLMPSGAR